MLMLVVQGKRNVMRLYTLSKPSLVVVREFVGNLMMGLMGVQELMQCMYQAINYNHALALLIFCLDFGQMTHNYHFSFSNAH